MSIDLAKLREVEDGVKSKLDAMNKLELLIAFAYIKRTTDISMDSIDKKILDEAKKRQGN